MLEEGRHRLRGCQEPHLVREHDEVEILVARQRERRQRLRLHVGRLGEGVEEAQEGPGKGVRLPGPQYFLVHLYGRVRLQRRDDPVGDLVELAGLRIAQDEDALDARRRFGRAGKAGIHWLGHFGGRRM